MKQATNTLLMIRPVNFRMNEQTAVNNYFQQELEEKSLSVTAAAQKEFDDFVQKLRAKNIEVVVVDDTEDPDTPDSIFPNNWISFHREGTIALYPMFAENRRLERREDVLQLLEQQGFQIDQVLDYTSAEDDEVFLEGTGSIVLDRENKKAYCALSPRADEDLFIEFCEDFEYFPVIFNAYQSVGKERKQIYHTNVLMCMADRYAVICLDTIDDKKERKNVTDHLKMDGKEIIEISEEQMNHFAGNMLQVVSKEGTPYLVMSEAAYRSLTDEQREKLEGYNEIIYSPLTTIETLGGGSARCMMAEVFLPKKQ
ncbi:citrulline utilization hydrolase CtlX [Robertkochia aurantiaca]|uniref:citrulline utilization hydrolase CtlX n=1 Tax=Robertkochia aurantiaca TaxID=2873700 RepID=UPI001CCAA453|nr:arginine deiminase-related protein [Robertkochia sp. 3YJGBD-33]